MTRMQNQIERTVGKTFTVRQSAPFASATLESRWLDRAGDEIEQNDRFSTEDCQLARASALEHGGFEEESY